MNNGMIAVIGLLGIAFASCIFLVWVIFFRLRSHLVSAGYKFIVTAKILWAIMCGAGIYLIIWPLPKRIVIVQLLWFSLLALGALCSAIGFYLYSRDVNTVLKSDDYKSSLPAVPDDSTFVSTFGEKR
jgi:hypothetical protein